MSDLIDATTVGDLLLRTAARRPDSEALVVPGLRRSHAELALLTESLPGLAEACDPLRLELPQALRLRSVVLLGDASPRGLREQLEEELAPTTSPSAPIGAGV